MKRVGNFIAVQDSKGNWEYSKLPKKKQEKQEHLIDPPLFDLCTDIESEFKIEVGTMVGDSMVEILELLKTVQ